MAKKEKKITSNMTKSDFITLLSQMTPLEINKYIEDKGKKPKMVVPFVICKNIS